MQSRFCRIQGVVKKDIHRSPQVGSVFRLAEGVLQAGLGIGLAVVKCGLEPIAGASHGGCCAGLALTGVRSTVPQAGFDGTRPPNSHDPNWPRNVGLNCCSWQDWAYGTTICGAAGSAGL